MLIDRRVFLATAAGGLAASGRIFASTSPAALDLKAIAFDAFPIFDPRPVGRLAKSLFPDQGEALLGAWRTRQFEYQWLRALGGRYVDFIQATEESLRFAARQVHVEISPEQFARLIDSYRALNVWPDVPDSIAKLREAGFRLAFVSNMTHAMLERGLRAAGLLSSFEAILSTDAIRSYKPDPRAYRMAVDALRLKREQILFVPFAGWDVAGAKWFGYPTFWVNRMDSPPEELGAVPDGSGHDLSALVEFVSRSQGRTARQL